MGDVELVMGEIVRSKAKVCQGMQLILPSRRMTR